MKCRQTNLDGLMHLVHVRVVRRLLAVVGEADTEDDGVDAVEQIQPLPSLRPLASDIVDTEDHVLDVELDLDDAGGPDPGVEDVLGGGDVPVLAQPRHVVKKIFPAVRQLILVCSQKCGLYSAVFPEARHDLEIILGS